VAVTVLMFALPALEADAADLAGPDIQTGISADFSPGLVHSSAGTAQSWGGIALHSIYFHPTAIAAWVGNVRHFAESLAGRSTGWRTHRIFSGSASAQDGVAPDYPRTDSHGALFLAGWLIWAVLLKISGMRHPMVAEWPEVDRSPSLVSGVRSGHADPNAVASALWA